ncbi:MAG: hypothetical protein JO126_01270 [Alphaproteobacteria bacterium]|nr:hypothetical protein [Alphaproteobacteria bacterium]MBV8548070.1 hypothetical protein [Alphaproteobacteria bacterium]
MSDALTIATEGLQIASTRVANASASIVNASSTSSASDENAPTEVTDDLAAKIVELGSATIGYEADAKVVSAAARNTGKLINMLA